MAIDSTGLKIYTVAIYTHESIMHAWLTKLCVVCVCVCVCVHMRVFFYGYTHVHVHDLCVYILLYV